MGNSNTHGYVLQFHYFNSLFSEFYGGGSMQHQGEKYAILVRSIDVPKAKRFTSVLRAKRAYEKLIKSCVNVPSEYSIIEVDENGRYVKTVESNHYLSSVNRCEADAETLGTTDTATKETAVWLWSEFTDEETFTVINGFTAANPTIAELQEVAREIMQREGLEYVVIGKGKKLPLDRIIPSDIGERVVDVINDNFSQNVNGGVCDMITASKEDIDILNTAIKNVTLTWIETRFAVRQYYEVEDTITFRKEDV